MPYTEVTLAELRDDLKEKWESQSFWTDIEARLALNQALRWWNLFTGRWKRRVVILTPAPASPWITVPGTLIYPLTVRWQDNPAMQRSSISDLSTMRPGWQGHTTADGGDVPDEPRYWAPVGLDTFAIYPADSVTAQQLVVDSVRQTPVLVNDADFVDLSEAEHHALLGEALFICTFKVGGARLERAGHFHAEFLEAAADTSDILRNSALYRKLTGKDLDRASRPLRHFISVAALVKGQGE